MRTGTLSLYKQGERNMDPRETTEKKAKKGGGKQQNYNCMNFRVLGCRYVKNGKDVKKTYFSGFWQGTDSENAKCAGLGEKNQK